MVHGAAWLKDQRESTATSSGNGTIRGPKGHEVTVQHAVQGRNVAKKVNTAAEDACAEIWWCWASDGES
jgi:hypothetical protein